MAYQSKERAPVHRPKTLRTSLKGGLSQGPCSIAWSDLAVGITKWFRSFSATLGTSFVKDPVKSAEGPIPPAPPQPGGRKVILPRGRGERDCQNLGPPWMCMCGQAQWGTKDAKEPSTALLKALYLRGMCNCHIY